MEKSDIRDYVRPPILKFKILNDTNNYKEYQIKTDNISKVKDENYDIFTNYLNSFIFCNPKLKIKMPKKSFMIKKNNNNKKFAYAFGLFPNPKTGKSSYLDGCILGALGLKRQKTNADIICFVTHDVNDDDISKLNTVFDKVIKVPYISPFDMGGEGELKTIMMDKDIFKNCNNYTKNHPYSHVFFKLHIFNPELFPYEKVCFVDSDLVPLNYYDSLFMLETPAGWVEYRKKFPYLESFNWDRCDFLEHGSKIPKIFTDIDTPGGSDINAGLLVITPNKKEYDDMIKEITSPIKEWMGKDKLHKGFYDFNFETSKGSKFVKDSYCFPEQNYLTKRFSGKWTYIEYAFQSWSLDPCNSFGIHMAAFNPKPWFKQPSKGFVVGKKELTPYNKNKNKKEKKSDIIIALAIRESDNFNHENVSYTYELFNDLIIWGLVKFPELVDFFMEGTQIWGTKTGATEDVFKQIDSKNKIDFVKFRDIEIKSDIYKKLSLSQQYIVKLLTDYDTYKLKIKDNYLSICKTKIKNKINEIDYDFTIINYPDYKTSKKYNIKSKTKGGKSKKKTLPKLRKLSYKNKKHKYKLKDPQKKRILAIDEGIKGESKKTKKSIKKSASKKKARFNVLRIYRRNNNIKDCKKITKDMKYIDKKYNLGETKEICGKQKQNGGSNKSVIYYYKIGCPACDGFDDDWNKLKKEKNWNCEKIKYSDNINPEHKKVIKTVPAIFIDNKLYSGNRSDLFNM